MHIQLDQIYKRFIREWVIEDFNFTFSKNNVYGIKGSNGSGKSTLLKIISSALLPSKGKIIYEDSDGVVSQGSVYQAISAYSAGDEMIEEYTAEELFDHRSRFKEMTVDRAQFFKELELVPHKAKQINTYSSGMKQRLALGLCIYTKAKIYLFDEPSSYLDTSKKMWFNKVLKTLDIEESIVIIASNDDFDFELCTQTIELN